MEPYKNLAGNSGVAAYEIGRDTMVVQFKTGMFYSYTYASAGRRNIEHMKRLARNGEGLATFISQHVGRHYAAKWS